MLSYRTLPVALVPLVLLGCPDLTRPSDQDPAPGASNLAASPPAPAPVPTPSPRAPRPAASPTPERAGAEAAEETVQASHILAGWKGAERSVQTRTKEEARKRIEEVVSKLKKGQDFAKLAAEYGEDGTKMRGGDLGVFSRSAMIKPFADAAFALKPGEISGVVETPFGYHVIKRTK